MVDVCGWRVCILLGLLSYDETLNPTSPSAAYKVAHTLQHADEVTAVCMHPVSDYAASASLDRTWALHDTRTGQTLAHYTDPEAGAPRYHTLYSSSSYFYIALIIIVFVFVFRVY